MKDGRGDYLANLVLYPGRPEFTAFLPENTQVCPGGVGLRGPRMDVVHGRVVLSETTMPVPDAVLVAVCASSGPP